MEPSDVVDEAEFAWRYSASASTRPRLCGVRADEAMAAARQAAEEVTKPMKPAFRLKTGDFT